MKYILTILATLLTTLVYGATIDTNTVTRTELLSSTTGHSLTSGAALVSGSAANSGYASYSGSSVVSGSLTGAGNIVKHNFEEFVQVGTLSPSAVTTGTLVAWFRPDSLNGTNGSLISSWPDSSSNANNADQSNTGLQPMLVANALNGYPALSAGQGHRTWIRSAVSSAFSDATFFVVCRKRSKSTRESGHQYAFSLGGIDADGTSWADGSCLYIDCIYNFEEVSARGGGGTLYQQPDPTQWQVRTIVQSGTSIVTYLQGRITGGLLNASAARNVYNGQISIGALDYGVDVADWDFAEIVYFKGALSNAERGGIETYLHRKFHLDTKPLILFMGDSITQGWNKLSDFPSRTMVALGGTSFAASYDFACVGSGGAQAGDFVSKLPYFATAARGVNGTPTVAVIEYGTNDYSASIDTETIKSNIKTICASWKAQGARVIYCTPMARQDGSNGATQETARQALIASVKLDWWQWCDALADIGSDPTIGTYDAVMDTGLFFDKVHPNDGATVIMGSIAADAIRRVLGYGR